MTDYNFDVERQLTAMSAEIKAATARAEAAEKERDYWKGWAETWERKYTDTTARADALAGQVAELQADLQEIEHTVSENMPHHPLCLFTVAGECNCGKGKVDEAIDRALARLSPDSAQKENTMDLHRKRPSLDDIPDEVMKRIVALYDRKLNDEEIAEIEDFGQRLAKRLSEVQSPAPQASAQQELGPYRVEPMEGGEICDYRWLIVETEHGDIAAAYEQADARIIADALNARAAKEEKP